MACTITIVLKMHCMYTHHVHAGLISGGGGGARGGGGLLPLEISFAVP